AQGMHTPGPPQGAAHRDRGGPPDRELGVQSGGWCDHDARGAEELGRRVEAGEEPPLEQEIRLQALRHLVAREKAPAITVKGEPQRERERDQGEERAEDGGARRERGATTPRGSVLDGRAPEPRDADGEEDDRTAEQEPLRYRRRPPRELAPSGEPVRDRREREHEPNERGESR